VRRLRGSVVVQSGVSFLSHSQHPTEQCDENESFGDRVISFVFIYRVVNMNKGCHKCVKLQY